MCLYIFLFYMYVFIPIEKLINLLPLRMQRVHTHTNTQSLFNLGLSSARAWDQSKYSFEFLLCSCFPFSNFPYLQN